MAVGKGILLLATLLLSACGAGSGGGAIGDCSSGAGAGGGTLAAGC